MNKYNVAIIVNPWQRYHFPSIQAATLKSFVEERIPEVEVDVYNIHLLLADKIGFDVYSRILDSFLREEHLFYNNLLHGKRDFYKIIDTLKNCENISQNSRSAIRFIGTKRYNNLLNKIDESTEEILQEAELPKYDLIGVTISFSQLIPSLYIIKRIKNISPKTTVVIGGSGSLSEQSRSLMENFEYIDMAVSGEGELNLYHIIKSKIEDKEHYKDLPGIIYREDGKVVSNDGFNQLGDLKKLEIPDYSDYFRDLRKIENKEDMEKVEVPLEFSRGCCHGRCVFCNIKEYWTGYRYKDIPDFLEEIENCNKGYGVSRFILTDSIIPESLFRKLFEGIGELREKLDEEIEFYELESTTNLSESTLRHASENGLRIFWLGVESLSKSLLNKMKKPTDLIHNVQALKFSEIYLDYFAYCLIINHPLSTREEVEETLDNIDLLEHLRPPYINRFRLHMGSEIYNNPEQYKVKIKGNCPAKSPFPPHLLNNLNLMYKEYEIKEDVNWEGVIERVESWRENYNLFFDSRLPILYHFQKDDRTVVVRRRVEGNERYELEGLERKIYNFCETAKSFNEIKNHLSDADEKDIREALEELKNKKLFFESNDKFIALPLDLEKYRKE